MRLGSLCAGFGGLDLAVSQHLAIEHAWHAETDPAASSVLAARWPGVPNLGDITAADWAAVEPIDILTAGFPCQPFSSAGKRAGGGDERHLWPTGVLPAITALRPPLVVLENVPGLLTIDKGAVFGQVLADLDELGYAISWTTVGACKVGACHHRHRIFIAATLANVGAPAGALFGLPLASAGKWPPAGMVRAGLVWELPADPCGANSTMLPTPRVAAVRTGRSAILGSSSSPSLEQAFELARGELPRELRSWDEAPASWLPTPMAADGGAGRGSSAGYGLRNVAREMAGAMLPTPTARDAVRGAGRPTPEGRPLSEVIALLPTPKASDSDRGDCPSERERRTPSLVSVAPMIALATGEPTLFGAYATAVRRQELAFGLGAPYPTEPGRLGRPRLSPAFCEWLIGLPAGWITDVVGRTDAIRIAGNGVVHQAAAYALSTLPTFIAPVASTALERAA